MKIKEETRILISLSRDKATEIYKILVGDLDGTLGLLEKGLESVLKEEEDDYSTAFLIDPS